MSEFNALPSTIFDFYKLPPERRVALSRFTNPDLTRDEYLKLGLPWRKGRLKPEIIAAIPLGGESDWINGEAGGDIYTGTSAARLKAQARQLTEGMRRPSHITQGTQYVGSAKLTDAQLTLISNITYSLLRLDRRDHGSCSARILFGFDNQIVGNENLRTKGKLHSHGSSDPAVWREDINCDYLKNKMRTYVIRIGMPFLFVPHERQFTDGGLHPILKEQITKREKLAAAVHEQYGKVRIPSPTLMSRNSKLSRYAIDVDNKKLRNAGLIDLSESGEVVCVDNNVLHGTYRPKYPTPSAFYFLTIQPPV